MEKVAPGRTSGIPLHYGDRVFGTACLEFAFLLPCNEEIKRELDLMFETLARIIWLNHTTNNQLADIKRAPIKGGSAKRSPKPKLNSCSLILTGG
jgi:hypothetical protein